jgi:hypothetical protein
MALAITAGFLLSVPAAFADTVSLTLATSGICSPYVCGTTGSTVSVTATVAAPSTNAADVYLNSDDFTVDSPLSFDDSPFYNFPLYLTPGQSYTDVLFNITIPESAIPGYYSGYFDILGGPDGGTLDLLAAVPFTVDVTPEPSSFLLFGSGIVGILTAVKRRMMIAK